MRTTTSLPELLKPRRVRRRVATTLVFAQDSKKCAQLDAGSQNWKGNIDWSIRDSGPPNCPQDYPYPECLVSGNRSCLMKKAIQSAKDNDYANAFRLAKVAQCHNQPARDGYEYCAGQKAIGDYLRTK